MPSRPRITPAVGKVRPRNEAHEVGDGGLWLVDEVQGAVDDFAHVVRRHVGGHSHRDARAPVHQEIRKARRQDERLGCGVVEVRPEVDGLLVDVGEHRLGELGHAAFGVAVGGGRISVDAPEVSLTVDEQVPHVPRLGEPHQRVIDGGVSMGVVLLEDLPHHTRALAVLAVVQESLVLHGVEDASVHGLQPVPHVGERAPDDDRHRVVEVAAPHLVLDVDGDAVAGPTRGRRRSRRSGKVVGHGEGAWETEREARRSPSGRGLLPS